MLIEVRGTAVRRLALPLSLDATMASGLIPFAPGQGSCHQFEHNKCTAVEAEAWEKQGKEMGFTTFNPAAVNWNVRDALD